MISTAVILNSELKIHRPNWKLQRECLFVCVLFCFSGKGCVCLNLTGEKWHFWRRGGVCIYSEVGPGIVSTHSQRGNALMSSSPAACEPQTLSRPTKREWTAPHSREILSKLVKRITLGGNKDGMHINEYLHKCLHHKIHPGKQHCKGAHTKRNIHISAFPHADTPPPHWRS